MGARWARWVQMAGKPPPADPGVPAGNIELHFDGDFVTQAAGVVSAALNQAPSGATRDASQATAGSRPSVGTPLNSHGTVLHDGSADYLDGVFGGGGYTYTDCTVVALTSRPATTNNAAVFDSAPLVATNTGMMLFQQGNDRIVRSAAGTDAADATFLSTAWTVHVGLRKNSTTQLRIYRNSTLRGGPSGLTTNSTLQNFRLGGLFSGSPLFPYDGSWAEILLYSREWDPAVDIPQYLAHVNVKYGLALA